MKKKLLWLAILEVGYVVIVRIFLAHFDGGLFEKELYWSLIRFVFLVLVFFVFRDYLFQRKQEASAPAVSWTLILGVSLFISIPFAIGSWGLPSPLNYLYAGTSIVVGFREEFVYRGVLQKLLEERFGILVSLLVSNLIFVFYHYGAMPFTPWNVFQFFFAGTILGLIYYQTRNLVFVSILHALYDAVYSFSPIFASQTPLWIGYVLLIAVVAILSVNATKTKNGCEPVDTDNPVNPPKNSKNQLDD